VLPWDVAYTSEFEASVKFLQSFTESCKFHEIYEFCEVYRSYALTACERVYAPVPVPIPVPVPVLKVPIT
jgi:hypothetical protein